MDDKTPIYVIKLAGLMFVATLAAMVAMAIAGQDTATIEHLVGPLLSTVIVTGVVGAVTQGQNSKLDQHEQKLTKIQEQTNGILDARIRRETQAALLELQAAEQTGAHATPLEEPVLDDLVEEPVTTLGLDPIRP